MHRVIGLIVVALVIGFGAGRGAAEPAQSGPDATTPADVVASCTEACHRWLIDDTTREVIVEFSSPSFAQVRRVHYAADWMDGCPRRRVDLAYLVVTSKQSAIFLNDMIRRGFCPRVRLNGVPADAPYLTSRVWNDIAFDLMRASVLTRAEYAQFVLPALQRLFVTDMPGRWETFATLVRVSAEHADLLAPEIKTLFRDPDPSRRQETHNGASDKASSVTEVADAVTQNGVLVDLLLDELDADPTLSTDPGYRRLIDQLAGIGSSVPTWGSPPVCANVDRLAKHLPWGAYIERDATFLATLSRCDTGPSNLLRRSFQDARPRIVATSVRVWWAGVRGKRATARDVTPGLVALVMSGELPETSAAPVYTYSEYGARMITESSPIEEAALGLSALGLMAETVDRLGAAGHADWAQALSKALEQGLQRWVPSRQLVP